MTEDEREIRALLTKWHSASAAGDVSTVLTLMSEDVVFLVAGQAAMEGRAQFEKAMRDLLATHQIVSHGDIRELVVSGNLAYVWSVLRVNVGAKSGGPAMLREGNVLTILQRQADGAWLVFRDANLLQ